MIRNFFLFIILSGFSTLTGSAQSFVKTADLFKRSDISSGPGQLTLVQDPSIDTLISRYILANRFLKGGMEGYRIQIFRNSTRTAREESNKVRADFMVSFPDITSYIEYAEPGWFLVKVGDFRTKMEGTKSLYMIRKKYPNAYLVPSIINFPDLKKD